MEVSWYTDMSVSVIVPYAILLARSVPTPLPAEFSRVKVRVEGWSRTTSPGPGNPDSMQCPLDRTSAGSPGWELGVRTTDPEQLLSATVPAKPMALGRTFAAAVAAVWLDDAAALTVLGAVASWLVTANAGAVPAPRSSTAKSAPTRGFFMWGSPLVTCAERVGALRPKFFRF